MKCHLTCTHAHTQLYLPFVTGDCSRPRRPKLPKT